jgi:tRNA(fMet)-specific endonuclease VapC
VGLIIDTNVLIRAERDARSDLFPSSIAHDNLYISAITVSELLVGVHLATSEAKRNQRSAFVESLISVFPVLDFFTDVARIHAGLYASLRQRGELIGANDLIIAATAFQHGFAVFTGNEREFNRIPGLKVIAFEAN